MKSPRWYCWRSAAQLEAIREALAQIDSDVEAGGDGEMDADIFFHRSIAEATGNPHFLALIQFLFNFLRTATQTTRAIEATQESMSYRSESSIAPFSRPLPDKTRKLPAPPHACTWKGQQRKTPHLFRPRGKSSTGLNSLVQTRQITGVPEVFEAGCLGKVLVPGQPVFDDAVDSRASGCTVRSR